MSTIYGHQRQATLLAGAYSAAASRSRRLLTIDEVCISKAKLLVHQLRRHRPLVIRAWLWLAAQTDDLEEKRRCLIEVLQLDPENEAASLAVLLLDQRRPTS